MHFQLSMKASQKLLYHCLWKQIFIYLKKKKLSLCIIIVIIIITFLTLLEVANTFLLYLTDNKLFNSNTIA